MAQSGHENKEQSRANWRAVAERAVWC